jgi:hypothetical protein
MVFDSLVFAVSYLKFAPYFELFNITKIILTQNLKLWEQNTINFVASKKEVSLQTKFLYILHKFILHVFLDSFSHFTLFEIFVTGGKERFS